MLGRRATFGLWAGLMALLLIWPGRGQADPASDSQARVSAALDNILALYRPGQEGLATVWDGDKYVQCLALPDHSLRCEAGGPLMQPSLARVLSPERVQSLSMLGWRLDISFGNYVQAFPAGQPSREVADKVMEALVQGYQADVSELEVSTDWVTSEPCPPRNGPGQNLAGMINDAPSMSETAIHACAYKPGEVSGAAGAESAADLIALYGLRVTGEVQRLRVNLTRQVHFALNTDTGYVQCEPQTKPDAIYCEAESTDSWPGLASVLTPDRMARLHAAGYADPGRAPNYWKLYPLADNTDAAIARELISLLHDSYGYVGAPPLDITTETDPPPADDQPTNDKP